MSRVSWGNSVDAHGPKAPPPPPELNVTSSSPPSTPSRSLSVPSKLSPAGSGQGPFKPSQSAQRALFGIRSAATEIKVALHKIDPEFSDHPDRALLRGLDVLLAAAEQARANALKNQKLLATEGGAAKATPGPQGEKPQMVLASQLARTADVAKQAHSSLLAHQHTLSLHRDELYARWETLRDVSEILERAVADQSSRVRGAVRGG